MTRRAALGFALCLSAVVSAQELELPGPVAPPPLQGPTYGETLIAELQAEMQALAGAERGRDDRGRTALRASINVRVIAADLLTEGEVAGAEGSVATLAGIRLALGRATLDAAMAALDDPASSAHLEAFNGDAVDLAASIRTTDADALDLALPRMLAGLVRAIEPSLATPPTSHWPLTAGGDAPPASDAAAPSIATLRAALSTLRPAAVLRDDTAALASAIVDALDDASAHGLRQHADDARRRVHAALVFAETLAAADWLEAAPAYRNALHAALERFADPVTRDDGVRRIERLERTRRLLGALTPLRGSVDRRAIGRTLAALDGIGDGGADDAARRPDERGLRTLGLVVERMARYRALAPVALPRDLKPVRARLERAYEAAERELVAQLPALADAPHVHADPAFTTLLADQAQYLADVERFSRAPEWIAAIERVHPPAVAPFRRQLKRLGQSLLDANRRDDAHGAMRRLEREITNFAWLPYEAELAEPSRAAIIATGGLQAELRAAIETTRRRWVEGLAAGAGSTDAGDDAPAARMHLLRRLMNSIADAEDLLLLDDGDLLLERWAAWEMPRSLIRRGATGLPNRLKLATAAIVNGRDESAAGQLDRIDREAPVTRLVGRLSARLAAALAPLPDGAAGVLGRLIYPPPPDAWLLARRAEIAELCRYAIEADHAARHDRADEAEALHAFVNDRAALLLETTGAP